jgi:AcrR family transcriptional regulator
LAVKVSSHSNVRKTPETPDTRQKLVVAAIMAIERHGVDGATVRRIVAEAGVNVAAVNYHFGSKERLLEVALDATIHEAFTKALGELEQAILAARGNVRSGTARFLREHLKNAFRYPRIAAAHLRNALLDQDYSGVSVSALREFVAGFQRLAGPAMRGTPEHRRLAVIHVWATIYGLALLPELFGGESSDYAGEPMVDLLVRTLFG